MIKVQNLYHAYNRDGKYAVRDVSFEVPKGEVFGFLGPSGAGKSTTQNIITGLLPLQKGAVEVAGHDIAKPHLKMYNRIGVSFEIANLYSKMTALENLRFYAGMFDVPTRDPMELLAMVGLEGAAKKKAGAFSKGMKQRLNFARSMLNNPELWFLDEPTSGLDPAIAEQIKDVIKAQNQKGVTVFLTTHNMFIADDLCGRVAFIDNPKALKLRFGQHFVDVEYVKDGKLANASLSTEDEKDRAELANIVAGFPIRTLHTREATLEQIFIKVTGKGLISDETV